MSRIVILASALAACSQPPAASGGSPDRSPSPAPSATPSAAGPREPWNGRPVIGRGRLAAVYVEPVVYGRPDLPRGFLVAIWIKNLIDRPIGLAGVDQRWFVHANQWTSGDAAARETIDERTMKPQTLDAERCAELRRQLAARRLLVLEPTSSLQTYQPFDGPADIRAATGRHVIIAFDGEVLVTDGTDCESVHAKADGMTAADLVLPVPVPWQALPAPPPK